MTTVRHRIKTIKSPLAGCPGGDFLFSFNNAMMKLIDTNEKYHFVYKTINLINGKWYIGKHSTYNLDDGYLGSSKHLKHAIKLYGRDNFIREILLFCDNEEEAYEKESELVTMEVVHNPMTYNKMPGGKGSQKRYTDEELKEHEREQKRDYYQANNERLRERRREYYHANKEHYREYQREYHQVNKERLRERRREYMREYMREWREQKKAQTESIK